MRAEFEFNERAASLNLQRPSEDKEGPPFLRMKIASTLARTARTEVFCRGVAHCGFGRENGEREDAIRTARPASCTKVELACQGWTWFLKMTFTLPSYLPPAEKSGTRTLSIASAILAENGQT